VGSKELANAQRAEAENQVAEATRRYQALVQQVPFNEGAVLAAARFFTSQKAYTDAYDALNQGLTENPTSGTLLRAYALAAADAGLADLGQSALAQLRPRISAAEYANLLAQFAARRAAHAAASAAFDQPPLPAR
jgi:predicted Zn-dependent protease